MKLGLLGDIHGNSAALRAVLKSAGHQGVDALCVTGDLVGYYYHPDEVLELLENWETYRVRGNHEDMLTQVRAEPAKLEAFERRYGSGLRLALELLTDKQLQALSDLPANLDFRFDDCAVLLAHGAPWDADHYIYPDAEPAEFARFASYAADLAVLGHTHYRMQRTAGRCLIVNPGSVGQPRDRIPGAAWALFDTETRICRHFTEPYDITAVVAEAQSRDPQHSYLQEVLTRV